MRFRMMVLADVLRQRCTRRIKIAQCHIAHAVSHGVILQHAFNNQLGAPVHIGRLRGKIFANRRFGRFAVHRRRAAENNIIHAGLLHCLQQMQRAFHVVHIVFRRVAHAFANQAACRKMYNSINFKLRHYMLGKFNIADIALHQLHIVSHSFRVSGGKIIVHYRRKAGFFF